MNGLWRVLIPVIAAACAANRPFPQPSANEPAETSWPRTLVAAHREMSDGRYATADLILRDYAEARAGTAEAMETSYWRAVIALDPRNEETSPRDAVALLDRYLDSRLPLTHRAEAVVLRRLAASLAEGRAGTASGRAIGGSRDAEMQRLREELENTKAELERIRRRLAPPQTSTPPPPIPPPATPPPDRSRSTTR